jgi:hypothetical protein
MDSFTYDVVDGRKGGFARAAVTIRVGNRDTTPPTIKTPADVVVDATKLLGISGLEPLTPTLRAKLIASSANLIQGKPLLACAALKAFMVGIDLAVRARLIDPAVGEELKADARRIMDVIPCS